MARQPVPPAETVTAEFDDAPDLDALAEAVADEQGSTWSPTDPGAVARQFVQARPDAQIEVVFPTVYEEDRSTKLADLITAEGVGTLSHQRMAQQAAQELGFAQYDYAAEQEQIQREKKHRQVLSPTPDEDAAVEGLREDLVKLDRALDRLAEAVHALPPPVRVTMPETPPPTVEVRIPPVPDPSRLVKTVERDARGLISRIIVEGEP